MTKQQPHHRAGALALAVLAAGSVLSGCGSGSASPAAHGPSVPAPPVGTALAGKLLQQYAAANSRINGSLDATALGSVEQPPASVASAAGLRIAKAQAAAVPTAGYVQPRFVFPRISGWPRYFAAITPLLQSDSVSPAPKYLLFVQDKASAPWRVAYYPYPADPTGLPQLQQDSGGGAPAVTDAKGLLADPESLARAYNDYAEGKRDPRIPLAPTKALTGQLAGGYSAGVQALKAKGGDLSRTLQPGGYPHYLLRTRDGGVLAFTAATVRDTMTPSGGRGSVPLDAGSREAALAGSPEGAHAGRYVVDRLEMYLSYIPPVSVPGGGVQLIAYGDYPLSVR